MTIAMHQKIAGGSVRRGSRTSSPAVETVSIPMSEKTPWTRRYRCP